MMKRKIRLYCLILSLIFPITSVYAITSYRIEAIDANANTTLIGEATTWEEAQTMYNENEASHDNLLISYNDRIFKVKYGYLAFHKSATCDMNISYQQGAENGYTNGCYGVDAAYLSTSDDGEQVSFLLSGAYGTADIDDVDIYPMVSNKRLSSYIVNDKKLYHQIKTDMSHDLYSNSIYLGDAPEYLSEDMTYYSFDGHYFYEGDTIQGYDSMIDDLRNSSYEHALNGQNPYYNYYQYISHRTKTSYSEAQINAYLDETLHIQSPLTSYESIGTSYHAILTQSMLKSQGNAFLQYQDQFGANALMMMALSMNESATGRSYLAYTRNNVFGHAAFDSAVEENASRYASISASIYSHAKHYISNSYLNPKQFQYHGGYFGSKASGMNVSYASDPYWGEKAAQYYARLDEALGSKDLNSYALGIVTQNEEVNIYKEATRSSDILYTNESLHDFVFILLEKQGNWYKVQSDPASNEDGLYQYAQDVGYVSADDIDIILHEEKMKVMPTYQITFNADEGMFQGDAKSVTLAIEKDRIPSITTPQKEGALFTGWDKEVSTVTSDATYTAQYKNVKHIEVLNMKKTTYHSEEQLNVQGSSLNVTFDDDTTQEIPIDSSMVSNFDSETTGNVSIQVNYQGISTTFPITIQATKEDNQESLIMRVETMLGEINDMEAMTPQQKLEIIALKQELNEANTFELSYESYRKLDLAIQKAYGASLQILVRGDMEAQVSGLSIASKLSSPSFLPTVLKFDLSNKISDASQTMLSNIANANEYTPETFFELSGNQDFTSMNLHDDIIVAIKKPENSEANMHYLILQYKQDNVYQIPTSQSNNYITFSTDSLGEFALVSQSTSNIYGDNDITENNYQENNGYDFFKLLFCGMILILFTIFIIITILIRRKRNPKKKKKPNVNKPIPQEESFLKKHRLDVDEKQNTSKDGD